MSSNFQNPKQTGDRAADELRDRKLSGFIRRTPPDSPETAGRDGRGRGKTILIRREKRLWVSLLVDLILLILLAGLIVGGIFGYRAVRDLYAPVWEVRDVVFGVKMENIPPEMVEYDAQKGKYYIVGGSIWSSDATDADLLGTVTDIRTALISTETDGREETVLTLYLQVHASAYYREGKGYRMGETMLLAGSSGTYRLEGLTAEGTIIFMHETNDKQAHTSWSDQFDQGKQ
jgi:hypothetical protein